MKKLLLLAVLAVAMVFIFAACVTPAETPDGGDTTPPVTNEPTNNDNNVTPEPPDTTPDDNVVINEDGEAEHAALAAMRAVLTQFPEYRNVPGEHVSGSVFMRGMVSPAPFQGNFGGAIFQTSALDSQVGVMLGTSSPLLEIDEFFQFAQTGVATWNLDMETFIFTINLNHEIFWHDGVQLTLDDLVYTFYVMAHPDYAGIRFSTYERQIVGIMDYHNGNADSIEGLVLSNNNMTLEIHFENISPALLYGGIWTTPLPKHIFENIAVADMPNSPYVTTHPVGWGPFMIQTIVPGESVHMVRNVNYVWGVPYIEEAIVEIIEPSLVPIALESGRFDHIDNFPAIYFEDHLNPTNFIYLGSPNSEYGYIAFRLGNWDSENNLNVFNPDREMNNVYLRRAMAHAIDYTMLGQELFSGLSFAAGSFIAPNHAALMDLSLPGFPYSPEIGNAILDAAGFPFEAGGVYRTWPNGNPLTVIWAFPTNPATENIIVPFHIQSWRAIGVRVELWQGRTHDQVYLWDTLDFDADNDEIHIYTGRWVAGSNPNPQGRWGHVDWNPSRYNSPEWEQILSNLSDISMFDQSVMIANYAAMQAHLQEVVPYFPTTWAITLSAINNRVARWDTRVGIPTSEFGWHVVRLTAAQPYSR